MPRWETNGVSVIFPNLFLFLHLSDDIHGHSGGTEELILLVFHSYVMHYRGFAFVKSVTFHKELCGSRRADVIDIAGEGDIFHPVSIGGHAGGNITEGIKSTPVDSAIMIQHFLRSFNAVEAVSRFNF